MAVTQIFRKIEDKLYSMILVKTGHVQESQDLIQDVYESALRHLDSFNMAEDQAAWLFRTAQNKIIDWYRKRSRGQRHELDDSVFADDEDSLFDQLIDEKADLEDEYFKSLLMEALTAAVEALPEPYRIVIQAQALEGRSFRSLSEEWDVAQGTLLSRKRKALEMLRAAMDDFYEVWREMK